MLYACFDESSIFHSLILMKWTTTALAQYITEVLSQATYTEWQCFNYGSSGYCLDIVWISFPCRSQWPVFPHGTTPTCD